MKKGVKEPQLTKAKTTAFLDKAWAEKGAWLATKSGKFRVHASFEFGGKKIEDNYSFEIA